MNDLKFALRQLLKSPGFTAIALLTLALGIGANTAIFSTLDAVMLRPLPYPAADRLVQVQERRDDGGMNSVSGGAFLDWREHQSTFDSLTLVARVRFNLRGDRAPERVDGLQVSSEFFRVLGVPPLQGRTFRPEDAQPGGDNNVVVLTEEFWRSHFGADAALVGSTLVLDDVARTVIGIVPAGAWLESADQFFVPVVLAPDTNLTRRTSHWALVYGRLRAGVPLARAVDDLNGVKRRLESSYPGWKKDWGVAVAPLAGELAREARPALLALSAAALLVLLIACANVAGLLLARASERRQELAVRAALGASGRRLVRQALVESGLLAGTGGLLGVLFATWGIDLLRYFTADLLPRALAPAIDVRVLGFCVAASLFTGVACGLIPAWYARRPDLNEALKSGGRGATAAGRHRTQSLLVIAQVAITVILLAGAGLLLRSMARAGRVDLGFEPQRALAFDLSLPDASYPDTARRLAFSRTALDRIRAVPGVEAAGTSLALPFTGGGFGEFLSRAGQPDRQSHARVDFVSDGYLPALGSRLLLGRHFTAADNDPAVERTMLVNQTAARSLFGGENPIGESIRVYGNAWKIIGVIADIPDRRVDLAPRSFAYCPQAFRPMNFSIVVRTPLPPRSLLPALQAAVQQLDPGLPLANPRTLDAALDDSLANRRLVLGLIGTFAATALALAAIGLYGVMAYSVSMRRREFSIRLALGAEPGAVRNLVLRGGLRLMFAGLALGLAGALAGAPLMASLLFGVSARDPAVLFAVIAVLGVLALLACWLPARRATRVDPMMALRSE